MILVRTNLGPELLLRTTHTGVRQDGEVVAYNVSPPVTTADGEKTEVAVEDCFEYDKDLFDQINTHLLLAKQSMMTAIMLASHLNPVREEQIDPLAEMDEWFDNIVKFH